MYDAIVVGARCAGAATAMLLARRGFDVLLVDRAHFPSDLPHGHFIHRHGPARLHAWGLLDRVLATGCPAITSLVEDFGDFPLRGDNLIVDGVPIGLGPRRSALDAVLVQAAVEAGAKLRESFPVDDIVFDDDRVVGIRGGTGPTPVVERARIVIGADGRNSRIARAVRTPPYNQIPTLTCWYFSYWSGVSADALELYLRDGRVVFAFPTNDDLFAVFVSWPIREFDRIRTAPEEHMLDVLACIPELAARVTEGTREERVYGASSLPNYLRRPYGEGWALVGDAGCHKDPYLALGICDAFRDAELVTDAVTATLATGQPDLETGAEYERRRNKLTQPDFERNVELARGAPPPPQLLAARQELRGDPDGTRTYFLHGEERLPN